MVSMKVLVLALILCILVEELYSQDSQPRSNNRRTRNRNRGRGGNRAGNRGGNRAGNRGGNRGNRGGNRATAGRRTQGNANRRRCEEIQVPMCKGLVGYTRTKLPNRFNHTTQLQVYRVLEHIWALIDRGCSHNFRLLACSLFLPKCAGRGPAREPCMKTCRQTKRICQPRLQAFRYEWPEQFDCNSLPKRRCLKLEPHRSCNVDYTLCEPIDLPMCQHLSFRTGMTPNMFGQCNRTEIAVEMEQFQPLIDSNCSPHLNFFLCGVYMPFCTRTEGVLSFPCQELCTDVRDACEPVYERLTGGLPWPNKFQCHRYPMSTNANFTCVMPNEGHSLN